MLTGYEGFATSMSEMRVGRLIGPDCNNQSTFNLDRDPIRLDASKHRSPSYLYNLGLYSLNVVFQNPSRSTEQGTQRFKPKIVHVRLSFLPGLQAFVLRIGQQTSETCLMQDLEEGSKRRGLLPLLQPLICKIQDYDATGMWKSLLLVSLPHRSHQLFGRIPLIGLKPKRMRLCYLAFPCAKSTTQ